MNFDVESLGALRITVIVVDSCRTFVALTGCKASAVVTASYSRTSWIGHPVALEALKKHRRTDGSCWACRRSATGTAPGS